MRNLIISIISFSIIVSTSAFAEVLISDGFDYPDMATLSSPTGGKWGFYCLATDYSGKNPPGNNMTGPCTVDLVSNPVHGGTKSLRFTYANGTTQYLNGPGTYNPNGLMTRLSKYFTPVTEFYERYYVRFEAVDPSKPSGWADGLQSVGAKQHYFNPGGADPGGAFALSYFFYKYDSETGKNYTDKIGLEIGSNPNAVKCPSGKSDLNCDIVQNLGFKTMPYNQWVCIETHYKMNTIGQLDGVVELWQDGQLVLQHKNAQMRTSSVSAYKLLTLYRQDAVNQYRYEDDYVLATTRIGCNGTTPPQPGPTPTPTPTPQPTPTPTPTPTPPKAPASPKSLKVR